MRGIQVFRQSQQRLNKTHITLPHRRLQKLCDNTYAIENDSAEAETFLNYIADNRVNTNEITTIYIDPSKTAQKAIKDEQIQEIIKSTRNLKNFAVFGPCFNNLDFLREAHKLKRLYLFNQDNISAEMIESSLVHKKIGHLEYSQTVSNIYPSTFLPLFQKVEHLNLDISNMTFGEVAKIWSILPPSIRSLSIRGERTPKIETNTSLLHLDTASSGLDTAIVRKLFHNAPNLETIYPKESAGYYDFPISADGYREFIQEEQKRQQEINKPREQQQTAEPKNEAPKTFTESIKELVSDINKHFPKF